MRFKKNEKYFTISVYIVGTMITIILIGVVLFYFRTLWGYLANLIKTILTLLKPLIFGLIIAYLFDPLVNMYDDRCVHFKRNKSKETTYKYDLHKRTFATFLAFLTFIALIGVIIIIVSINIREVIGTFNNRGFQEMIGHYIDMFTSMIEDVSGIVAQTPFVSDHREVIKKVYTFINNFTIGLVENMENGFKTFSSNLIPLALGVVIAFYALNDKKKLLIIYHKVLDHILPKSISREVRAIGSAIDYVFSGYIRGQILDAIIMATLISIVLTLIGIDFAVIIGIISGIFNLIPYFGPVVGFVLAGFIGLMGPEPIKAVYAVLAVMALQQLDGWVIVPRIMGETVKLHPIVVLLSIVIGGQLFGFIGFLIGVPIAGFIRLIVIRYMGNIFEP